MVEECQRYSSNRKQDDWEMKHFGTDLLNVISREEMNWVK